VAAPGVAISSGSGANDDDATSLGTTPPIAATSQSQATSTTTATASTSVAISGVSAPGTVSVIYNQGATTSNTTAPSSLIDEALSQVGTSGKKKSSELPDVHRRGNRRHPVIRSSSSHPTRRPMDKLSHRNKVAVTVSQSATIDGSGRRRP
jgi:hypothetical protein